MSACSASRSLAKVLRESWRPLFDAPYGRPKQHCCKYGSFLGRPDVLRHGHVIYCHDTILNEADEFGISQSRSVDYMALAKIKPFAVEQVST